VHTPPEEGSEIFYNINYKFKTALLFTLYNLLVPEFRTLLMI